MDVKTIIWDQIQSNSILSITKLDYDIPSFNCLIVRSAWDYPERPLEFLNTMETISSKISVWNDVQLMKWNAHKR